MKKNWMFLYLFCLAASSYAESIQNPNVDNTYDGEANYERVMLKVADDNNIIFNYRFARDLDVYHQQHNKSTNYVERIKKDSEDMDYVGINLSEFYLSGKTDRKSVMYFGKGNNLKDLKVLSPTDFTETLSETHAKEEEKFYVHKGYSSLHLKYREDENRRNPLSISIEEYKKYLEGKSKEEQSKFMKEKIEHKLQELGIQKEIHFENGTLYTEENGQKYPIFYEVKPVTVIKRLGYSDVYDDVYNVVWINNILDSNTEIEKILYTKAGDLLIENLGNDDRIEFFGRGRIDGEIDLQGKILDLAGTASVFQGKYGRNIVLGPKAKLNNIKQIRIGKDQLGSKSTTLLAGLTSLALDVDPSVKNEKGNIVGHAFGTLDPNMDIRGEESLTEKNLPTIQLMVSKIPEEAKVEIDRSFQYQAPGQREIRKLKFIPDSIAHHLDEENPDSPEHAILSVSIKDKIKRLSDTENEAYKSIATSKQLDKLSPTTSAVNKKLLFSHVEIEKEKEKKAALVKYLMEGQDAQKIIEDLSEFNLSKREEDEVITLIQDINQAVEGKRASDRRDEETIKEISAKIEGVHQLGEELKSSLAKLESMNFEATFKKLPYNKAPKLSLQEQEELRNELRDTIVGIQEGKYYKQYVTEIGLLEEIRESLGKAMKAVEDSQTDPKKLRTAVVWLMDIMDKESLPNLGEDYAENKIKTVLETNIPEYPTVFEDIVKDAKKRLSSSLELKEYGSAISPSYRRVKELLYYTLRDEESLQELKTMLAQLQETNIYAKMNKVAKNELTTYTNIPFDINRSLGQKKHLARGGYISARNVQANFRGNTYTAYALYENQVSGDSRLGLMIGGGLTNHSLTHTKRTAKTVPAVSSSKGTSAYVGAYYGKSLYQELDWISGLGLQYGQYKIRRNLKNNYQTLTSKGDMNIYGGNAYSGLVLNYPLQEDVVVQVRGILSYSVINQSKVQEREGLSLDVREKKYQYLDSELGFSLNKTLYDFGVKSNLSAGVYRVFGLAGYKNKDLEANVQGSSNSFAIKGDQVKKDALKLYIDYNVQKDSGLNYGLDGSYITNSEETDVRFGFKAGYTF